MSKLFITNKIPVSCISQPHLQSQSCVCDGKPIQYFPSTWCIECWWRPWRCQPTLIHIFHICGVLVRTGCCQLWLINVYHSITVFSVPPHTPPTTIIFFMVQTLVFIFTASRMSAARRCSVSECLSSMILKWLLFSVLLVDARIKWYFIRISFLLWNDWRWSEFSESLLEFSNSSDIDVHQYVKYSEKISSTFRCGISTTNLVHNLH